MAASLSNARRCLLAAKTAFGVTLAGVVSTEEAREDSVGFMKEFFFIFLNLSSDRVPPAAATENECSRANEPSQSHWALLMMFAQRTH